MHAYHKRHAAGEYTRGPVKRLNLAAVDLNLLTVLEALLDLRSVTKAAQSVGLSQPATSRALGRLRVMFKDRILVRTAGGLVLTPLAESMAQDVKSALVIVRSLLERPDFDPQNITGRFRMAMLDHQALLDLPLLFPAISRAMPGIDLEVRSIASTTLEQLEADELDLAIGWFANAPAGYWRSRLYFDEFATMVRSDHPLVRGELTAQNFAAQRHALVSVMDDDQGGSLDEALAAHGLQRRIALKVGQFAALPRLIRDSDLISTMPRQLAELLCSPGLTLVRPPFDLPSIEVSQLWHERRHGDPKHVFMRSLVSDILVR